MALTGISGSRLYGIEEHMERGDHSIQSQLVDVRVLHVVEVAQNVQEVVPHSESLGKVTKSKQGWLCLSGGGLVLGGARRECVTS